MMKLKLKSPSDFPMVSGVGLFSPFRVLASKSQAPSSYLFYICCKLKLPALYSQYVLVLMTQ